MRCAEFRTFWTCGEECSFSPITTSYSCDIAEGEDMSDVKHGETVCSCLHCPIKLESILWTWPNRKGAQKWIVYKARRNTYKSNLYEYLMIKTCVKFAKKYVINSVEHLLVERKKALCSKLDLTPSHWQNDCISIHTVEPQHFLHLGVSKKLKQCAIAFLSALELEIKWTTMVKPSQKLCTTRTKLTNECSNCHAGNKWDLSVCNVQIGFSTS